MRRRMRMMGSLLLLFTTPLVILMVHKWPRKIIACGTCHWKVWCLFCHYRITLVLTEAFELWCFKPAIWILQKKGMDINGIFTGKEGKHFSAKLFLFFFLHCIMRHAILINSLLNGLLSGWEIECIPQFTSSFWNCSPWSEYSKKPHKPTTQKVLKCIGMHDMHVWCADFLNSTIDFCVFTELY